MSDCVAWAVEEVEGAVAEVVEGWELADLQGIGVEGDFSKGAAAGCLVRLC